MSPLIVYFVYGELSGRDTYHVARIPKSGGAIEIVATESAFPNITGGTLREIPAKSSKRRIVLERIAVEFDPGVRYSESEVNAVVGRTLLPEDDVARGGHAVVMLGFEYWRTAFEGRADAGMRSRVHRLRLALAYECGGFHQRGRQLDRWRPGEHRRRPASGHQPRDRRGRCGLCVGLALRR